MKKKRGKNCTLMNAIVIWDRARYLVVCPNVLATAIEVNVNQFNPPIRGICGSKSKNTALKPLHLLSRCEFFACVRPETASRVLCLALYVNLFRSLSRVVMGPIVFNTSDSKTWRSTGLHAIGHIFGLAAVDDFFGRGVIRVVRQMSGNTPVLMES